MSNSFVPFNDVLPIRIYIYDVVLLCRVETSLYPIGGWFTLRTNSWSFILLVDEKTEDFIYLYTVLSRGLFNA